MPREKKYKKKTAKEKEELENKNLLLKKEIERVIQEKLAVKLIKHIFFIFIFLFLYF